MMIDDDLQRRFDTAKTAIDLDVGSAAEVKGRAIRRTRQTRLLSTAAVVAAVAMLGFVALRGLSNDEPNFEVAAVAPTTSATDGTEATETTETTDGTSPIATSDRRVTEADLTYLGAFMLPAGDVGDSSFAYGGEVAAFNPYGDPASNDGFDGSLFISTHQRKNVGIAEIAIPAPAAHNGETNDLPIAEVLAEPVDITAGRGMAYVGGAAVGGQDEYHYGGLQVADGPGGPRLHWSIWQYNDVNNSDVPGHGHSSLDLSAPDPQGPWFLGDYTHQQTTGYLFTVPQGFADASLAGNRFVSGLASPPLATGPSSGPPFFAFTPPAVAEPGERLDALTLALYDDERPLTSFGGADIVDGAAWVSASDGASAIVTVGRRGLGEIRSTPNDQDCVESIGVHAGPYEPQISFYDPADLASVAAGELDAADVAPYRTWNPADQLVYTCEWLLSSVSFDDASGRIYLVQMKADTSQNPFDFVPVVHVFEL